MADDFFDDNTRGLSRTLDAILGRDQTSFTSTSSVDIDTLYARGRNALLSGHFADAVRALQEVVDRKPNHSWAHYLLGRAHHPLGNTTQAERHFRRATALRPAFSLENITDAERHLGKKDYMPALWAAERAAVVARYTAAPETTLRTIAETLNTVGVAFKEGKETPRDIAKAKKAFETAAQVDPQYVHPYYHLGTIARAEKDYRTAENRLRKAVELNPRHSWAHFQLGAVYEALGENHNAREAYQRAATLGHKEAAAYMSGIIDDAPVKQRSPTRSPQRRSRPVADRSSPRKMNDYAPLEALVQELNGTTFMDSAWMEDQKVSIIIPSYNRKDYLRKTLLALGQQTYPLENIEVVIADDGSSDGTSEMVEGMNLPFRVKYIWQQDDGFRVAKVRNEGMKAASHDHIILLDNDMLPKPTLVEKHMRWHYAADALDVDFLLIGRRLFAELADVTDQKITNRQLDTVPITVHARTGSSVDWRETNTYPKTKQLRDMSGFADPEWVMSSTVCSGNISFKKDRAFAAGLFDEHFKAWGREDKYFGDSFYYTQALFPDKPLYFVPVLDAEAFHLEHPVNTKVRKEEIDRTNRLYREKLVELRAKTFFPAPTVSVYIPAWNAEQFIEQAIESVRKQTYKDVEVCVVEDKGDDNTWSVLERLTQKYNKPGERPFLRIERNEKNSGIGPTSNKAARMCKGEYILQLDSDDYITPQCIEKLLAVFEKNPNVGLVFGDCLDILPDGTTRPHWSPIEFTEVHIAQHGYQKSLDMLWEKGMRITHPRMFTREAFYRTQGFAEDIENAVDYDIFMKLSEVTEARHLPEILYHYRTNHGNNTSVAKRDKQIRNAAIVQQRGRERRAGTQKFQFTNVEPTPVYDFTPDKQWPVSVYMPLSLGNVRYLEESLDSILTQTHQRTGICIGVDDTPENAAAFFSVMKGKYSRFFDAASPEYGRVKYKFTNKAGGSGGAAAASNAAMDLALDSNKSSYVLHLDPDDKYCHPAAIERLVQFMEKESSCVLGYADFNHYRDGKRDGSVVSTDFSRKKLWNAERPYNQVGHPRIYRAETLQVLRATNNGKTFNEDLSVCVDLDLILRVDKRAQETGRAIKHYDGEGATFLERLQGGYTIFADYRVHPESISSRKAGEQSLVYRQLIAQYSDTPLPSFLGSETTFIPLVRFTSLAQAEAK